MDAPAGEGKGPGPARPPLGILLLRAAAIALIAAGTFEIGNRLARPAEGRRPAGAPAWPAPEAARGGPVRIGGERVDVRRLRRPESPREAVRRVLADEGADPGSIVPSPGSGGLAAAAARAGGLPIAALATGIPGGGSSILLMRGRAGTAPGSKALENPLPDAREVFRVAETGGGRTLLLLESTLPPGEAASQARAALERAGFREVEDAGAALGESLGEGARAFFASKGARTLAVVLEPEGGGSRVVVWGAGGE